MSAAAVLATAAQAAPVWSAAREWDEQILSAIRLDRPRPPVHARNLYHMSAAMWDAWAAYDPHADQLFHHERATAADIEAARAETISYAAYRLVRSRYVNAVGATTTLAALDAKFTALGYDINNTSTVGNTPAALGNRIFQTISTVCMNDGSNQVGNYAPNNGYATVNPPLIIALPGTTMQDPNRWQPLAFSYYVEQNGIVVGATVQAFVCPHWANVNSFALTRTNPAEPYIDPGPPPLLGTASDAQFRAEHFQVVELSSELDPSDNVLEDISPGVTHNNPLGTNDGVGYPVNPVTGQPYASNIVKRADYARVLAEFWADGPDSETPPGHWNVVANKVSDDPLLVKRVGGVGPVVNGLEWDVKLYLSINGAVHDAAIGAWGLKGKYDSVRPISAIRYMCGQGQSSDPSLPSYNPSGARLIPGLVELITPESCMPGQRHAHLADYVNQVAIRSWRGQPEDPLTQFGGVDWILGKNWKPYQKNTFVTPPFAGYTSGHSTFSRSAAEVMAAFTGSPFFPGGLATYTFNANSFLTFEQGPTQTIQLQWATYFDAADEAGISRLYGGIHISADDLTGRIMGSTIGKKAYVHAQRFFDGRVSCPVDYDRSGGADIRDLFGFLGLWFSGDIRGDFNESGTLTVLDIYDFLAAWFAGC